MDATRGHTLPRTGRVRIADSPPRSRPSSLYDNVRGPSLEALPPPAAAPTLATGLCTTVPQSVRQPPIGGRHQPTRSSLRHSRMVVLSRQGEVPRKYQPRVLRRHRLATALAALQTLLGAGVATLSAWLLLWAPRLPFRDIPYWSAAPVLASGVCGLLLLGCCRKEYPGRPHGGCVFAFKVLGVALAAVAGVACLCACAFALLHVVFLSQMACVPPRVLNATCVCQGEGEAPRVFHYPDLNCLEVENLLTVLLIGSCAANGLAGVAAVWYVLLHWTSRYASTYAPVRHSEPSPGIIRNTKVPRK